MSLLIPDPEDPTPDVVSTLPVPPSYSLPPEVYVYFSGDPGCNGDPSGVASSTPRKTRLRGPPAERTDVEVHQM